MTLRRWVVYAGDPPQSEVNVAIGPESAGPGWSVRAKTLRGEFSDGVVAIEVDNGAFRFVVLPTRGMSLWRGWIQERQIGWQSWVAGPVHPRHVPLDDPAGYGWLAGFDELLVRCGLASNGPPEFAADGRLIHPQHGRIANIAAHEVEVTFDEVTAEIAINGTVAEQHGDVFLELKVSYRTSLGRAGVSVHDEICNMTALPAAMQLLYHVNFGSPLLTAGARVAAPVSILVPREPYEPRCATDWNMFWNHPAADEEVYFGQLSADSCHQTRVLLQNATGDFGASLAFDVRQLPCFTLWKMMGSGGGEQVTGLEPGTNFPNSRSFEAAQGRMRELAPAECAAFDLELDLHRDRSAVECVAAEISELRPTDQPCVFTEPQAGWSPNFCKSSD